LTSGSPACDQWGDGAIFFIDVCWGRWPVLDKTGQIRHNSTATVP